MSCRFGLGVLRDETTTMATHAAAGHTRVVHGGRRPVNETAEVAGIALGGGRNMRGRLGLRIGKIV